MSQRGSHTWDRAIHYHRCPFCSFIFESRKIYEYLLGKYQKDLECLRCNKKFTVTKNTRLTFGPLLGEPEHVEIDWSKKS